MSINAVADYKDLYKTTLTNISAIIRGLNAYSLRQTYSVTKGILKYIANAKMQEKKLRETLTYKLLVKDLKNREKNGCKPYALSLHLLK